MSPEVQLDSTVRKEDASIVVFDPEMKCKMTDNSNLCNNGNEGIINRPHSETRKQDHENDTLSHINGEDELNIETKYVREISKGNAKTIENILKPPIASFSKTHGFQMMSVTNIIILSTLFGVVLTKDLGGLRENGLLKDTSK